jgi:hypothetical protein
MTAILQVKSITCLDQQEVFKDELYLTFNGTKVSLPNMTQGRTRTLSIERRFDGSTSLSLFENDGDHWWDRDDFIGTHTISESQTPGDASLDFEERGRVHYQLIVAVTPG